MPLAIQPETTKRKGWTMQRREFCKLIAVTAAAGAIPAKGQSAAGAPSGFNKLRQTYEEFCAISEDQRVLYALVDGKVVDTRLSTKSSQSESKSSGLDSFQFSACRNGSVKDHERRETTLDDRQVRPDCNQRSSRSA
jgi:hypothetical protein